MNENHTLTRHRDIRNWVTDRRGTPAIAKVRDRFGEERAQLRLHFARREESRVDGGLSPCSWTAWLAELDRQQLALSVDPTGRYELVARGKLH